MSMISGGGSGTASNTMNASGLTGEVIPKLASAENSLNNLSNVNFTIPSYSDLDMSTVDISNDIRNLKSRIKTAVGLVSALKGKVSAKADAINGAESANAGIVSGLGTGAGGTLMSAMLGGFNGASDGQLTPQQRLARDLAQKSGIGLTTGFTSSGSAATNQAALSGNAQSGNLNNSNGHAGTNHAQQSSYNENTEGLSNHSRRGTNRSSGLGQTSSGGLGISNGHAGTGKTGNLENKSGSTGLNTSESKLKDVLDRAKLAEKNVNRYDGTKNYYSDPKDMTTWTMTCSGLVNYAYRMAGPNGQDAKWRTCQEWVDTLKKQPNWTTDVSKLKPGDVICWTAPAYQHRDCGHVAIYAGDGMVYEAMPGGSMGHAGVRLDPLWNDKNHKIIGGATPPELIASVGNNNDDENN